jgi:hypothetical protein
MNLLDKEISTVTFDQVVEHCKDGHKEGIELDYKEEMPQKGIQKLFAAFSNTRGGLVVFGVVEDRSSGLPKTYEGVKDSAKLVQQIHQQAVNISPEPNYEVHATNENKGKAFVLVKILEGSIPPYYIKNDPNIWTRTGDIANPIDLASPNAVRLMFEKKKEAKLAQQNNLNFAREVFDSALQKMEAERRAEVVNEKREFEKRRQEQGGDSIEFAPMVYQARLGTQASECVIAIQPYFPKKALLKPEELKDRITDYRANGRSWGEFPNLNAFTIPNGILNYRWSRSDGQYSCSQILSNGLVHDIEDIRREDNNAGTKQLSLVFLAARLFLVMRCASNIYRLAGFQAKLVLSIALDNVQGLTIRPIEGDGRMLFSDNNEVLMPNYSWEFECDTRSLFDDESFLALYMKVLQEIYWSLGENTFSGHRVKYLIRQNNWMPIKDE